MRLNSGFPGSGQASGASWRGRWCGIGLLLALALAALPAPAGPAVPPDARGAFQEGMKAWQAGDSARARQLFEDSARGDPASGTWQNLGQLEWLRGRTGPAVLAWERAAWVDPWNTTAREDLRYARKNAQLEAPDLAWYEVISTWLPVNAWPWITGLSFWFAVGAVLLPGILRGRRTTTQQALAALGLTVFLLSLPAYAGVITRTRIGVILEKDTLLRLTPTSQGQSTTRLSGGDPARLRRSRGGFVLVRTSRSEGWVEAARFGLICPP